MSSSNEKLQRQLDTVPWLRGRGPVSYDYGKWVDSTHHLLVTLFGETSIEAGGFLQIVGEGAEARGWGLPLAPDNPWGFYQRPFRSRDRALRGEFRTSERVLRNEGNGKPGILAGLIRRAPGRAATRFVTPQPVG